MGQVSIKGSRKPIDVSNEEAEAIDKRRKEYARDPESVDAIVKIKGEPVHLSKISDVKYYGGVSNLNFLERVISYEKGVRSIRESGPSRPMEFYGLPVDQKKFLGYVLNDVLGGVHWSFVAYALKNSIITRSESGAYRVPIWSIRPVEFGLYSRWVREQMEDGAKSRIANAAAGFPQED